MVGRFGNGLAEGIGDEGIAPELEAGIAIGRFALEADTIYNGDINSISDRVRALDSFPGIELRRTEFGFFVGMPAYAGRIENNLRSAKSGDAGTFRIPLVPANLDADFAILCFKVGETKIAGSEIKFFVIERIVWNMHFAVFAEEAPVRVEYRAGVLINAGGAALKKRNYQDDFPFLGYLRERFGGRAGNWLGEVEKISIFPAAEILATEKFM